MIKFIFNNELINTDLPPASVLLDFIRKEKKLTGTKEGCREGDCGACTVLLGELSSGSVRYKPVNSCLVPLRDAYGKHLITVESFNQNNLSPVQAAIIEEGGTQCGFCTPGFVVSITGYLLNSRSPNLADAIDALGGNICRCTGYEGIKRAIEKSLEKFNQCDPKKKYIDKLIDANFIPAYFKSVGKQLINIRQAKEKINGRKYFVGGGTDLYVQNWEELVQSNADFLSDRNIPAEILVSKNKIKIGAGATIQQILESPVIRKYFPDLQNDLKLFGSLPIRNRATAAGNIVNASPIGDLTNILIALDAEIQMKRGNLKRTVKIRDFFKGYKRVDKKKDELIEWINFKIPAKGTRLNFEKVSKRTHLDIASVNSVILLETKKSKIISAGISAGGVAPVPLYLKSTSEYLTGNLISTDAVRLAAAIALTEISPISDARGSAEYKALLLRQLIYSHFLVLFPGQIDETALIDGGREL